MAKKVQHTEEISHAVARIQGGILAFVMAVMFGLGLFVSTVWLVIKGGENVGQHLGLLSQYFIGYDVTWFGAFIGLIYGAVIGGVIGWFIGMVYNRVVSLRK